MTQRGALALPEGIEQWAALPVPRALWENPEARAAIREQLHRQLLDEVSGQKLVPASPPRLAVVISPRPSEPVRVEVSVLAKRAA